MLLGGIFQKKGGEPPDERPASAAPTGRSRSSNLQGGGAVSKMDTQDEKTRTFNLYRNHAGVGLTGRILPRKCVGSKEARLQCDRYVRPDKEETSKQWREPDSG